MRDSMNVPIFVALRASEPLLEHAVRAYLESCPHFKLVPKEVLPGADVSVLLVDMMDDDWLKVLRHDAQRTADVPVPLVVMADQITETQLTLAVEYGLTRFVHRSSSSLEELVEAIVEASAGNCHVPDDLVSHLITELGRLQRRQNVTTLSRETGTSVREMEVLRMLAEGMNSFEIAQAMSYSERTVKGVIQDVMKRWKVRNRTEAVAYAIRAGII
ncbi:response regulator transcription factor [Streptomyces sp. NPDC090499]|uniref:helix-turn-helix transcriptional regulator n=1 Tax=Streptomyces sp. NPDC090499 TaxID=3365965 RepID=UPI003822F7AB